MATVILLTAGFASTEAAADCGDGLIDLGEQCDDSGNSSGDGCSSECQIEYCYSCSGEPSTCTPPNGIPQGNLIAHWSFDGNASDQTGNHNGTVVGAQLVTDRLGNPNSAYSFDGIDDYINVANVVGLKPAFPITVSAWVKPDVLSTSNGQIFTNDFLLGDYTGIFFNFGSVVNVNYGDGGAVSPNSRRSKSGTTPLVLDKWYHFAAVIRGPLDMDLYVDGANEGGTYSGSGASLAYSSGPGNIGRKDGVSLSHMDGVIDDIYFYNASLTAADICAIGGFEPAQSVPALGPVRVLFLVLGLVALGCRRRVKHA